VASHELAIVLRVHLYTDRVRVSHTLIILLYMRMLVSVIKLVASSSAVYVQSLLKGLKAQTKYSQSSSRTILSIRTRFN
jgi:hypothetical protein